jgi:hypothetical protein
VKPSLANGTQEIMTNAAMHVGYSRTPKTKKEMSLYEPALETHVVRGQSRSERKRGHRCQRTAKRTWYHPTGVETVMEASLCPMCSQALKISTIEPHETRDGVDVVTRRCPIHGTSGGASSSTKLGGRYRTSRRYCCCHDEMNQDAAKQRLAFAKVVTWL